MKIKWMVAGALAAGLVLAGCGGDDDSDGPFVAGDSVATNERDAASANKYSSTADSVPGAPSTGGVALESPKSTGTGDEPLPSVTDRKIIFTASLSVNSEDVGRSFGDATALARSNGGYVEKSQYANDAGDNEKRSASLTIRVPVQNYDSLVASLRTMAGVTVDTEGSNSNEVTEQYTDLQSRMRNLQRTEEQYLLLLNQAKSIQEILTVQDRLSTVRSQIEQIQGRLNVLDALTDFATVNLTVAPVIAKVEEPKSQGWQLSEVFAESWEASLEVVRYVAAGAIVVLVAGVWLVIPVALAVFGARRFHRKSPPAVTPLAEA